MEKNRNHLLALSLMAGLFEEPAPRLVRTGVKLRKRQSKAPDQTKRAKVKAARKQRRAQ